MLLKRILYPVLLSALVVSCSTRKNTMVSRAYHNLTARYNGYYYSNENIDEGVYKIERANKDNYEKILPVYIYPTPENAKSTFPEFDKAIKKSSLCIQRHTIKDKKGKEIPWAGKWIDNNWINIGIAHFYKREFFSGIEAFEYVVRTYTRSDDKYSAMLWLIKTNNEIGAVSSSEPILSLLKNERTLPSDIRRELPVAWADYYIRRGQNTEATAKLMEATRNTGFINGIPKSRRARYSFIIGQLSEAGGDNKRAIQYYKRTIKLKPRYEMVFYSKIKIARLIDVKRNDPEKTKKDLLKMTREFKNTDYFDVIYFTLGEIEEKQRNTDQAVYYYKKSVQTSVINPSQKAYSYLKLAEINFDRAAYQAAGAYYDSTIVTLPKDHPDYTNILARKKTLEKLVEHITTINREDSLQKVARMSESERNVLIDRLIEAYKKEEERKEREKEAALNAPVMPPPDFNAPPGMPGSGNSFYFYNPQTVALGVSEFTRKWGNRKLEDHWRRANRELTINEESNDASDTAGVKSKSKNEATTREFYLKGLPVNDSLIAKSNTRIIRAYYMLGTIYKEELNNSVKTISTFEELNTRFPDNRYALRTYYILYRTFLAQKNQPKADYYKEKILRDFPDSEFALLIRNPDYAEELNAQKSEVEAFYTETYNLYHGEQYQGAFESASTGIRKFGKSDYLPRFEFIRAMSLGKLKGIDTLEHHLKLLVGKYPKSEVTPLSEDVLLSIKKQKNPELFKPKEAGQQQKADTFSINFDAEHYIVAITPDDKKVAEGFKANVANFNNIFFSDKKYNISGNLFGNNQQIILIKPFPNAKEAMAYYENLLGDPDIFKGDVKRDLVEIYPILPENIPFLYQKKSAAAYKLFFNDNYKQLKSQ